MSRRRFINSAILILGLLLATALTYGLYQRQAAVAEEAMKRAAQDRSLAIQRSIETSLLVGQSLVNFYKSSDEVTREEFSSFVQTYLEQHPYIKALSWNPRVTHEERSRLERRAAERFPEYRFTERNTEGVLIPAAPRQEYFPVYFIEPFTGNEKALGYDVASEASRLRALTFAQKYNLPSTTSRIKLVQSTRDEWGFIMFFPVYAKGAGEDTLAAMSNSMLGLIGVVFDIPALVNGSLAYLAPAGLHITLYDESAPRDERFLHRHRSRTQNADTSQTGRNVRPGAADFALTESFDVNNRRWTLGFDPAAGYFEKAPSLEIWLVFLGAVAGALLLFAYLHLIDRREHELRAYKDELEHTIMERTRELRESNKALEAYSYSIAHDLRTPLRAITGFTQILDEDAGAKLNVEERGYLHKVIAAARHMAELLDDILELSRVARAKLKPEPVDLSRLSREVADRLQAAQRNGQQTAWSIEPGLEVQADRALMAILMENLLGNAQKFSARETTPEVTIGALRENGEAVYFVRDNGAGFDMEHADKLFRPFHRLHRVDEFEGTGIGLATAQRVIERHGGRIWAAGGVDEGATFYFTVAER